MCKFAHDRKTLKIIIAPFGAQDMIITKLGFIVVVEKSDHGSHRRTQYFCVGLRKRVMYVYKPTNKKIKFEDAGTRKHGCPFRLGDYFLASQKNMDPRFCPYESASEGIIQTSSKYRI
jgi:hypothetical protein